MRPSAPGWLSSVNTAEDVYSNDLGADFGWSLSDTAPLSAQCFDFFDPRGPLPPELAPWHDRLPKTEDEWEHIFRTDPRRARELNALVWRARPVVAPKP